MAAYEDFDWTPREALSARAQCETTWHHYLATKVHFDAADCVGTVCPVDDGAEVDPPLGPLHVINAIQPDTDPCSADNLARMAVLDHELKVAELKAIPAVGASLDDSYREQSRAIFGLTDEEARALGLRFGQVAVFAWAGPTWSLLACASERQHHRAWTWVADRR
ncbi:DUF3293 domain-containing protein [Mycolicibacterium llatzerense]|uniref:DUF3293 domain-containing protein n=1 Tax=Mycolicibacterium llatzerense TaxID=280871 RepID=UPI0008DC7F66|nr:DUF3293 domain-containing protein [Mycolicibacterium llatzerense]